MRGEIKGREKTKKDITWWDDEVKTVIDEKKKQFKKLQAHGKKETEKDE